MMMWTIVGSVLAVLGVIVLLLGTHQGNRANDEAHEGLSDQIQIVQGDVTTVKGEVETVMGEVGTLRSETAAGFEALSAQIANLNSGGDGNGDRRNTDNN